MKHPHVTQSAPQPCGKLLPNDTALQGSLKTYRDPSSANRAKRRLFRPLRRTAECSGHMRVRLFTVYLFGWEQEALALEGVLVGGLLPQAGESRHFLLLLISA